MGACIGTLTFFYFFRPRYLFQVEINLEVVPALKNLFETFLCRFQGPCKFTIQLSELRDRYGLVTQFRLAQLCRTLKTAQKRLKKILQCLFNLPKSSANQLVLNQKNMEEPNDQNCSSIINKGGSTKRGSLPSAVEYCILAWVAGLIWSEIKQLWDVGKVRRCQDGALQQHVIW